MESNIRELNAILDFRTQVSQNLSKKKELKPAIFALYISLRTRVLDRGRDFPYAGTSAIGRGAESALIVNRPDCPSAGGVQTSSTKAVILGPRAVVLSLKRLSTRRALGQGKVSRLVTTYCEDLSLWKARRDFLPLTPENPPRVSSRESPSFASVAIRNSPFIERHRVSSASAERIRAYRRIACRFRVRRDPGAYRAKCFRELGALSRSRNTEE